MSSERTLRVPVVLLAYNRPDLTERVLERVLEARPALLLIVADGPKESDEDRRRCRATQALFDAIPSTIEQRRCVAPANLGCKRRVASGLEWAFSQVEAALILEDDVLPEPDFFAFCETMLDRFRHEEDVLSITSLGFDVPPSGEDSYFFSRYPNPWGWATWRRAWQHYSEDMRDWSRVRKPRAIRRLFSDEDEQSYWRYIFDRQARGEIDSWAYHWFYSSFRRGGLHVRPHGNLVRNLGFREDATHTRDPEHQNALLTPTAISTPLRHPGLIRRDEECDRRLYRRAFHKEVPSTETEVAFGRLRRRARRVISGLVDRVRRA